MEIAGMFPEFILKQIIEELRRDSSKAQYLNLLFGQDSWWPANFVNECRNALAVKERQKYAHWLTTECVNQNLVYVDEWGFNLHTSHTRRRAPIGQGAVRQVVNSRGKNINLIMAISPIVRIVYHQIEKAVSTRQSLVSFWIIYLKRLASSSTALSLWTMLPCARTALWRTTITRSRNCPHILRCSTPLNTRSAHSRLQFSVNWRPEWTKYSTGKLLSIETYYYQGTALKFLNYR